ncbi:hypothetical protein DFP76_105317 [Marinomonas aquiplantarum]|uniref:Uncharacterized protein n=1 Tax=Marinomonas aquiplantarum TaxID=491951 RepID=A0A366D046_9GAMM|nr:hypothetical protein DFP76_105317 [Marinomonas aquiplantarum]
MTSCYKQKGLLLEQAFCVLKKNRLYNRMLSMICSTTSSTTDPVIE